MDFYEVIDKRRIVRNWKEEAVSQESVQRIIAAGLKAPSNDHLRNWEFVVLHSQQEKENALQFVKAQATKQGENKVITTPETPAQKMYAYAVPQQYTMLSNAPFLVIPLFKANVNLFQAVSVNGLNSFASIWCVVENMLLAATAEGLACSLRIPVGEEGNKVTAVLGVPEGYLMPCYLGIGYSAEDASLIKQHTYSAEQKMHFGKW